MGLRSRISRGEADPISDRERKQLEELLQTFIHRFGYDPRDSSPPWHFWYAWHPVRTRHHGWTWLTTVYRRQCYTSPIYWEYDPVTEDDDG